MCEIQRSRETDQAVRSKLQTNKYGFQFEDLTDGSMTYEDDDDEEEEEEDEDEEEDVLTNSWAIFS